MTKPPTPNLDEQTLIEQIENCFDDLVISNSGDMQGAFELLIKPDQMIPLQTETILVAPNKKIQKLWQKTYKGIEVVLSKDYDGYPLPGDFPLATRRLSQRLSKTQKPTQRKEER